MENKTDITEILEKLIDKEKEYFKNDLHKESPELTKMLKIYYDYLKEKDKTESMKIISLDKNKTNLWMIILSFIGIGEFTSLANTHCQHSSIQTC